MKIGKRIFLFFTINILIMVTISIVTSLLGVQNYLSAKGINYSSLMLLCVIWGFGGAFISLALSKVMAKWMMGVKIIDPNTMNLHEKKLLNKVYFYAQKAGISKMPEVGVYEGAELNAFATGATKNSSLVAVSTGLLNGMTEQEVDGVLAHEVAHIANGDMVTMTLVQGVVNAFVMFFARIIGYAVSNTVDEEKRPLVQMLVIIAAEILLGFLGMLVVAKFSRAREFRADEGGAALAGTSSMVSALRRLQATYNPDAIDERNPSLASLKINGKKNGFLQLFSTHPDLSERIRNLERIKLPAL